MSIEAERSSCPYCSTKLQYHYINLTEKMLICTKKKCLFPFDLDDVSPYITVDPLIKADNIAAGSSSSSSLLDDKFLNLIQSTSNLKQTQSKSGSPNSSSTESLSNLLELSQTKTSGQNKLSGQTKTSEQTKLSGQTKSNGQPKPNGQTKSNGQTKPSGQIKLNGQPKPNGQIKSNGQPKPNGQIKLNGQPKSIEQAKPSGQTKSNGQTKPNGQTESNRISLSNSESLFGKVASNLPEGSTSNLNDTITLKTLGVTLKVDAPNKNKNDLQQDSSQLNGLSTNSTANNNSLDTVENDLTQLFNMNDFPISPVEGSAITGNGLLNANAMTETGNGNALTVEEYSKMLFGQTDIDINLDDLLSNANTMDLNAQGNDAMDIDELLGTFDSLESSTLNKTPGNDMNLDFDSFMANLDANFAEVGILNGMSGNDLNVDLNSILENANGNNLDLINSNDNSIVNGPLDVYAEMVNGNGDGTDKNHNTLDLTLGSVNEQNGYSYENFENGVEDLVEDEGKDVVGKTVTNGALTEGKKVVKQIDHEMVS